MAHESEELERTVLQDLQRAATPEQAAAIGLEGHGVEGAFACVASALPASAIVINRVLGLGLEAPATRAGVRRILAMYADAGVERFFVQRHPEAAPSELVDWLVASGLEKTRGWQKFRRGRDPIAPPSTTLEVRAIGPEDGDAFGRIASDAFDLGPLAAPWLARLPGRPGWHVFMSFDGDRPAGTGALYVDGRLGWLDFGATAPAFRRRGGQAAVLAARVRHALDLGCERLYTCTGEDVPGDPQHSYKNIVRAGFHEDYVRENYAPPKR